MLRLGVVCILLLICGEIAAQTVDSRCKMADPNSTGRYLEQICWFQFGRLNEDLLTGASRQYSIELPDGSRVTMQLAISGGVNAQSGMRVMQAPTWTGSNFSGASGYYRVPAPNTVALNAPADRRSNGVVTTVSDVRLFGPDGREVTDVPFEVVIVDAERLNSRGELNEMLDFGVVSGGMPLQVIEWLGPAAPDGRVVTGTPGAVAPTRPSACWDSARNRPSGVDCIRVQGISGGDAPAIMVASRKDVRSSAPFTVMAQIHSLGRQGVALGIRWGGVRLRKELPAGRADVSDQFTYRLVNIGEAVADQRTTTAADGAQSPWISVAVMPGAGVKIIEEMAPGSRSPLSRYHARVRCTDATGATLVDRVYDPADPPEVRATGVIDRAGYSISCALMNTPLRMADVSVSKSNAAASVVSGVPTQYRIVVRNVGPDAADDAVVRDPAVAGLTCTAVSCGDTSGGATCPALSVAQLQSASGVRIPALPAGGRLTLTLTCIPD